MPVVESSLSQYTGVDLVGQVSLPMSFCEKRTICLQVISVSLWSGKPKISWVALGRAFPGDKGW